jgi:chromosome segregation ATPase
VQFSKLKLVGFKSFVEPTELRIEKGLTGVVGPNGCGKSNIVEALRWVMGENAHKNMRGSNMDDVIFAGSLNRPPYNMAQVTLFLDNHNRTAQNAFNDSDELMITRRIERDLGSNYSINGKEVRNRDVQLLFADQSTGPRSPSLVGQGRIGALISAKPHARRALLEDAAGISGLQNRRHEAELRLKATEQNLERLSDRTAQLRVQIDSLKRQARSAVQFETLSHQIRCFEAMLFYVRLNDIEEIEVETQVRFDAATLNVAQLLQKQNVAFENQAIGAQHLHNLRDEQAKLQSLNQRIRDTHTLKNQEEIARNHHAATRQILKRVRLTLHTILGEARTLKKIINEPQTKALQQESEGSLHRIETDIDSLNSVLVLHEAQVLCDGTKSLSFENDDLSQDKIPVSETLIKAENLQKMLDQAVISAISNLSSVQENCARIEEQMAALLSRKQDLKAIILDKARVEPKDIFKLTGLSTPDLMPDIITIERSLERFKQERHKMGAVNLRAKSEQEQLTQQLDLILTEREDIARAVKTLRHAIYNLNKEARLKLLTAFNTVQSHFSKLFMHLFGGGTAQLQLIEGDDPLDVGLDIIAKPPGKKPQSISLLSGGEQALTALALIFAVFLTKPAPICVLDEVDAPLDDHNVERYCNLLDEMTRITPTRFLIITHNPITMARMHRLYGVTMSEPGISQLVSVDLQDGFDVNNAM